MKIFTKMLGVGIMLIALSNMGFSATPELIQQSVKAIDSELNLEYSKITAKPMPIINDDQFVRRAYLSIIGRIPTYEEYEKFTRINSPIKRTELVKYLVNTPGYTSHFYNFWAEQLRVRERINNVNFLNGVVYIDWLKKQIHTNVPYDKFVKEILTAKGDYYTNGAVGYLERDLGMPLDNVIATMKVFNGIDWTCAQCHDSPFTEWTQKQFYQLASIFGQAEPSGRRNPQAREKVKQLRDEIEEIVKNDPKQRGLNNQVNNFLAATLASVNVDPNKKLKYPFDYKYRDAKPNDVVEPKVPFGEHDINNVEDMREDAVDWMIKNDTFAKNIVNRYWGFVFGKPIVDKMDELYGDDKTNDALLNLLANTFKKLNYNNKDFIQVICSTQLFQRQIYSGKVPNNFVFIGPIMKRLSAEQLWDSVISIVTEKPEYFTSTYVDNYKNVMNIGDFTGLTLNEVRARLTRITELNAKKYEGAIPYKGYMLVRASEINDNNGTNTILRMLGQSDRELIGSSSLEGSVTQVISLVNGPMVDIATMKDSALKKLIQNKSPSEKVEIIFKSILARKPTIIEKSLFEKASDDDLIWALINTNEFKI